MMHILSDLDQKNIHGGMGSNSAEISEKSTARNTSHFEDFLAADQKSTSFDGLLDLTKTGCCD